MALRGVFIDSDGTLIAPPPVVPYVAPAPAPPAVAPAAPAPAVAPAAPAPAAASQPAAPAPDVLARVVASGQNVFTVSEPAPPDVIGRILESGQVVFGTSAGSAASEPEAGLVVDPIFDEPPWTHWEQDGPLDRFDLQDLDSEFLAAIVPLRGETFVQYVRDGCASRDLEATAVFAESYNEGLAGGIGDSGRSYGPWQLYKSGKLPTAYRGYPDGSAKVNTWAWSKEGIDYALDGMVKVGAAGKRGVAAVTILTRDFEVPADWEARNLERIRTYEQLTRLGGGAWPFLSGLAKGPKTVAAAPAAPAPAKPAPVKVMGAWRELVATMRDDVPAAGVHLQNVSRRLRKVVA